MIDWYKFILKILPDGKAFRSILFSKIFYETIAYGLNLVKEYAVLTLSDQVWYVNDNFNPEPWERRYQITPPQFATLDERRTIVKTYMMFPQSQNRLSLDYIQQTMIEAGFTDVVIQYNPTGLDDGYLNANDISNEKLIFNMGTLTYNSFIISGLISVTYYYAALYLIMSLKPLQVAVYDQLAILHTIAFDNSNTIALDDNYTLTLTLF